MFILFDKGMLFRVEVFLVVSYNFFKDDYLMPFNDLIFLLTQALGGVSLIFLLIDYLFSDKKDGFFLKWLF